jgi:hypothetical protein
MASPAPSTSSTQGETQFIPQSDDEETLWKVIEITAERPKQYKVRWDGLNPENGRPWAQSWVPKGDCTDDLRKEWKKKGKKREEEAKKAGKGVLAISIELELNSNIFSIFRKIIAIDKLEIIYPIYIDRYWRPKTLCNCYSNWLASSRKQQYLAFPHYQNAQIIKTKTQVSRVCRSCISKPGRRLRSRVTCRLRTRASSRAIATS